MKRSKTRCKVCVVPFALLSVHVCVAPCSPCLSEPTPAGGRTKTKPGRGWCALAFSKRSATLCVDFTAGLQATNVAMTTNHTYVNICLPTENVLPSFVHSTFTLATFLATAVVVFVFGVLPRADAPPSSTGPVRCPGSTCLGEGGA